MSQIFRLEHLLRVAAERRPSQVAIRDREQALSYSELDEAADRVAAALAAQGVGIGDRVGLYLERSAVAVVALYGTMRSGAAYVPMDPAAPVARAAYIAKDAAITVLISDSKRIDGLREIEPAAAPRGISVDAGTDGFPGLDEILSGKPAAPPRQVTDTDLAYILYTSGSTGRPKGVAISHRSSLTFVRWAHATLGLRGDDVFSNHAPFHFDLSTFDLFASAMAGATVCLVPHNVSLFPGQLAEWIRTSGITVWYSVPSALTLLVRYGELDLRRFERLRLVLFAGEVFPPRYLARLMRHLESARFFNLYGPTETNVCTYEEILAPPPENGPPVLIGRACENSRCRVIDDSGVELTEVGAEGELVVTGSTVAEGYWGDEEQTRLRFPAPSTHRTGDIVQIAGASPAPRYRFVGRRDQLIKTRGYRVELGEVEAAIYAHPAVEECIAVAVPDELMGSRIVAFSKVRGDQSEMERALVAHCRSRLPSYMVPERILVTDRLPRTTSDKFDRVTLASRAAALR